MKIEKPNGLVLDDDRGMAKNLTEWAARRGLKDIRVFYVTEPGRQDCYLIVQGTAPIKEGTSVEELGCFLDMLALAEGCTPVSVDEEIRQFIAEPPHPEDQPCSEA